MRTIRGDGRDERVQLIALLLQLLDQRFDGALRETLAFAALPMAHQRVHDRQAGIGRGRCTVRHRIHVM